MHRPRRSSALLAIVVVGLITAAAGTARLWNLGHPDEKVFDEVYYASDGCLYAGVDHRDCELGSDVERSWVHPPLGKHIVSWGVHGFGNRPLGWRMPSALAGTATVALVGALAFLLTGSAAWAGVAALLLGVEHLHFVQSRIAMLDVFQTFFAVLGFLLLVWDRVRRDRLDPLTLHPLPAPVRPPVRGGSRDAPFPGALGERDDAAAAAPAPPGSSGPRWLRVAAGAAFGAGAAVKWWGIYALVAGALLALVWERTRRARAEVRRPLAATLREEGPSLAVAFVLAPLLLYVLTWTWWLGDHGFDLGAWLGNHGAMAEYHLRLEPFENGEPIHPYMSRAWTWLVLLRPVAYYYEGGGGTAAEILGIGNPVLFWGTFLMVPYLAVSWWRRRDWRAGAILLPILFLYVPWLFVTRPLFLFYMTPVTPFLALGATLALRELAGWRIRGRRLLIPAGAVVVAAVSLFVFFWPVLVGDTIGRDAWDARMWLKGWV